MRRVASRMGHPRRSVANLALRTQEQHVVEPCQLRLPTPADRAAANVTLAVKPEVGTLEEFNPNDRLVRAETAASATIWRTSLQRQPHTRLAGGSTDSCCVQPPNHRGDRRMELVSVLSERDLANRTQSSNGARPRAAALVARSCPTTVPLGPPSPLPKPKPTA